MANTAAPDSTKNLHTWTLLQEAAQCSGVLCRRTQRGERCVPKLNGTCWDRMSVKKVLEAGAYQALSSENLLRVLVFFLTTQLNRDTWAHWRLIATKEKVGARALQKAKEIKEMRERMWKLYNHLKQDKMYLVLHSGGPSTIVSARVEDLRL